MRRKNAGRLTGRQAIFRLSALPGCLSLWPIRSMKQLFRVLVCAIITSLSVPLLAATGSVRLTVTKKEDKDRAPKHDESRSTHQKETKETVSYTVEAMNLTGQPLTAVRVRWAVPVSHPGMPLRVERGEKSNDLKPMEKFSFEAGPIEIRARGGKSGGHGMEAWAGNKVVGSDIQPADTK